MKLTLLVSALFFFTITYSQNVGIGISTPGFPLNFESAFGDKISLFGNSGSHYGFGVQGGLLQMHSDAASANIAFGYGSSGSFIERARIINSGGDGMELKGRMTLRNGTSPLDINYGSGVWMYKADNSAMLGFMGVQNNQNIGFYGGTGGWGFTYNALNSYVGIGNNNPNAPLTFAATLEKKITLYPGATGDAGFGVSGNRLQIYADNPNADVAIGYDAAGTFNERFAVKANGALALYGNTGTEGQLLMSNGNAATAAWVDNPVSTMYSQTEEIAATNAITLLSSPEQQSGMVPGLTKTLLLAKASKVIVRYQVIVEGISCALCGVTSFSMFIGLNGINTGYLSNYVENNKYISISGMRIFTLGLGTHTININGKNNLGPALQLASGGPSSSFMFIEVIPQN